MAAPSGVIEDQSSQLNPGRLEMDMSQPMEIAFPDADRVEKRHGDGPIGGEAGAEKEVDEVCEVFFGLEYFSIHFSFFLLL